MRILIRNTVFKTATLAGLFLCMLAFGGVFFGTTTSAHAVHADEVDTEGELKQFVKEALDAYYINFIIKTQCDFDALLPDDLPIPLSTALGILFPSIAIQDLSPESIQGLSTDEVKQLISTLDTIEDHPTFGPIVQGLFPDGIDIWESCTLPQPTSTFRDVFTEEENWRSDSIYLFVMDDGKELLFHGDDEDLEGQVLRATDEGGRDVGQLLVDGAEASPKEDGSFVKYCWDNPAVPDDNIDEADNDPAIAPGDSLKISYVIDPFEYLGINPPMNSPGVIFGSGIYPGPDPGFPECDGNGMADGGGGMAGDGGGMAGDGEEMDDMQEPADESMDEPGQGEMPTDIVSSVSGGGCAITSGSDGMSQSNAFNLLLLSALFFTVLFRRRATDKRNSA